MSRSGLYLERLLAVPPRWSPLLSAVLNESVAARCRRDGVPVPDDFAAWLADLEDYASGQPACEVEAATEPSAWVDVTCAAEALGSVVNGCGRWLVRAS